MRNVMWSASCYDISSGVNSCSNSSDSSSSCSGGGSVVVVVGGGGDGCVAVAVIMEILQKALERPIADLLCHHSGNWSTESHPSI